jgi:serine/threonine protein kinase
VGTLSDIEADWPRISALLDEVMARPAAERGDYIDSLTAPDDRLRETLRELLQLQARVETEDFMDALPVFPGLPAGSAMAGGGTTGTGGAADSGSAGTLAAGAEVGPYRLLRPIGEGGMGAVWLAERADGALKRKVALKLPRLAWASDLAARMARERDILSALEHPNIARLYDAGVDALGRPWLAIEYVKGRDLATFCDTARLDLRARVRIFLQVLSAVQYAHASLVIHRDLKPANILVTPQGEVRLLDFGIARLEEGAADVGPALTRDGRGAMTPRYASPEQVQGKRLTIASDVYSLGVVLHELLTGETPYTLRRGTRAEYEQAIVESDLRVPSRTTVSAEAAAARSSTPRTLARTLRGDLDAVLMRALAPAPEGRYASAAALRDDLGRWLEGRSVSAVPPSRTYALRKFVARNRIAVAATAAAALALVAVSVVAVLQAQRAERSAAEAREEAARANATKDFVLGVFSYANPLLRGGREATARDLLDAAEQQLDRKLKGQPILQAEILDWAQRVWGFMGEPMREQRLLERRTTVLLDAGERVLAAAAMLDEADIAVGRRSFDRAGEMLDRLDSTIPSEVLTRVQQGKVAFLRGQLWADRGDRTAAMASYLRAEEILRAVDLLQPEARRTLYQALLARVSLGGATADLQRSRSALMEAEALLPTFAADEVDFRAQRTQLALTRYQLGDYERGWPEMQRLMAEVQGALGPVNPNVREYRRYWLLYCLQTGRLDLARAWLRGPAVAGDPSPMTVFGADPYWRVAVISVALADGDWRMASNELAGLRAVLRAGGAGPVGGARAARWQVRLQLLAAELALRRGRAGEALGPLVEIDAAVKRDPGLEDLAWRGRWMRALADRIDGRPIEALTQLRLAESEGSARLGAGHPLVARVRLDLAVMAAAEPSISDEAVVSLLRSADAALAGALPSAHPARVRLAKFGVSRPGPMAAGAAALRQSLAAVPSTVYFF